MPFLLLCGFGTSAFFAILGTVAYSIILVASLLGTTNCTMNGQQVDKATFLREMIPFFLAYPLLLLAFGVVAYGLWREKGWTRAAIMAFWLVALVGCLVAQLLAPQPAAEFWLGVATFLAGWAIAAWYLYGKASVRDYYRALSTQTARLPAELARRASA